ncbi:hypothetical protein [Chlorobium phaeobacteroides]|uniref:MotA/TolQ/ExbB proton channel domain-containing protein n=1 Tax=Chlorobium phaeobacteroides (strain DSM 266 / SMG 266 / 2430) TaxID=290317 RepID=A1BIK2_CHLPD|nr:hypothetical protein [Chlorobium phaeobacteroides]ABL66229.1 hypothetical protein Cpha266_2232 [Chlorobium phaeobacteroides DSM 266]
MKFIFEGIALILVNTFTVWVISGGIFGYAIFSLLRSRKALALCQESVDVAINLVKNYNKPEDLYTEYEQVNSSLESNHILSQPWREFNKTILKPEAPGDKQILHSPFPASHYFTTDRLLQNSIPLHFYHALPNYLTGAGILGTFVGLAAGIYLAQEGLSNPALVLKALQLLLDGASLSFVTSIAGLLGSIVFAVGFKNNLHKFDNNRAKLVDMLDANIEFLSLEQLNKQELDLSRQRTDSLDTFFNQIAFNLTEHFGDVVQ